MREKNNSTKQLEGVQMRVGEITLCFNFESTSFNRFYSSSFNLKYINFNLLKIQKLYWWIGVNIIIQCIYQDI